MEFTSVFSSHTFQHWIVESLVVFFLVGGLALLAVGLSLSFHSTGTLQFLTSMNRWVSTRRSFKWAEIPRDTRQAVQKYRRWLAAIFIAGGAFALYGLATRVDDSAIIYFLRLDFMRPAIAFWLIESVKWVLIVGNIAGLVVGIMLGFFPDALAALEGLGAHWYSDRKLAKGSNTMILTLDKWVAAFPRASGWIITAFAVFLIVTFGLMLTGSR